MRRQAGRADGRNLLAELQAKGYAVAANKAEMNAATGKKERVGRLLKMHANKREDIKDRKSVV